MGGGHMYTRRYASTAPARRRRRRLRCATALGAQCYRGHLYAPALAAAPPPPPTTPAHRLAAESTARPQALDPAAPHSAAADGVREPLGGDGRVFKGGGVDAALWLDPPAP